MKHFILIVCIAMLALACTTQPRALAPPISAPDYIELLKDSVDVLNARIDTLNKLCDTYENTILVQQRGIETLDTQVTLLSDSIIALNEKPLMSPAQFIDLYRYERIVKYYKLCERTPTNWKYFKGWVYRAIHE